MTQAARAATRASSPPSQECGDKPASESDYTVVWRTTDVCDLRCGFCQYSASNHFTRLNVTRSEVLRFGQLLAGWGSQRGRRVLLSWLGGEPFLWHDLLNVCTELRGSGLRTSVTTNGHRAALGGFEARDIAHAFSEVTVSLDGYEATHDESRGNVGLYRRIFALLTKIGATNMNVTLRANVLITRRSLPQLREIVADCAGVGVSQVSFNVLWLEAHHELAELKLRPSDLDYLEKELVAVRELVNERCAVLGSPRYVARLRAYAQGIPILVKDCGPARSTLFIDSDGRVAPCAYTVPDYGLHIEQLRTAEDIDGLPTFFRELRLSRLASACHDCPDTNVFGKFEWCI